LQGGQQMTPEQQQQQQEAQQAADEQRQSMLHAIMQPAARERCARWLDATAACICCQLRGALILLHLPRMEYPPDPAPPCVLMLLVCLNTAVQRIALVKPEKARGVEDLLLNAAKRGQLGQKVQT
jgi:DNA-binding TFAR19-related protein (PDSD5 family)